MSVFGGDSWARESQHRKRRVDDLLLSDASSYKKLSNGKYACLVCPNNPILDTPLMISMHNKGSRHIAAETRLKQRELSRQGELNKRIALAADSASESSSGASVQQSNHFDVHKKPLIEQTRKAILKIQCHESRELNTIGRCHNAENIDSPLNDSVFLSASNPAIELSQNVRHSECKSSEKISNEAREAAGKVLANWQDELRTHQEKELKFTMAGWKRDCHGRWCKDENVEFDSDEEDPNESLN